MADTKHKFSSLAAPTPEDVAAWDALSDAEKRAIARAEIEKGLGGNPIPVTDDTRKNIKSAVLARHARLHESN